MQKPVNKRASLPGASELFRRTQSAPEVDESVAHGEDLETSATQAASAGPPPASGRVRHDQKITVYFSSEELFALEDATLACKRSHGLRVDRGRLVRSAIAIALADLAERGEDSDLVAALRAQ